MNKQRETRMKPTDYLFVFAEIFQTNKITTTIQILLLCI